MKTTIGFRFFFLAIGLIFRSRCIISKRVRQEALSCGQVVPVCGLPHSLQPSFSSRNYVRHPEFEGRRCTLSFRGGSDILRKAFKLCVRGSFMIDSCNTAVTISYSDKMRKFTCRKQSIQGHMCALSNQDLKVTYESNSSSTFLADYHIMGLSEIIQKPAFINTINLINDHPCRIDNEGFTGTVISSHLPDWPEKSFCVIHIALGYRAGGRFCMEFMDFVSYPGGAGLSIDAGKDGLFFDSQFTPMKTENFCIWTSNRADVIIKVEPGTDPHNRLGLGFIFHYTVHDKDDDRFLSLKKKNYDGYYFPGSFIIFFALVCCSCCFYRRKNAPRREVAQVNRSDAPVSHPAFTCVPQLNTSPTRPIGYLITRSRNNGEAHSDILVVESEPCFHFSRTISQSQHEAVTVLEEHPPEGRVLSSTAEPPSYQSLFPDR